MKLFSFSVQKTLCLLALAVTVATNAHAYPDSTETVDLHIKPFTLYEGETRSVSLGGDWHHIRKIYVQANGANNRASTFQVVANGDVKGTIYVPGSDPSYVVTIGEVANSIQLQHVTGGAASIRSITVVRVCRPVSDIVPTPPYIEYPWAARNEASMLARQAITFVDRLQPYANFDEYGAYLLPIKKAAGRAYAAAQAKGSISATVHNYLVILKSQIDYATPYVDETFERSAVFELVIELRSLGERLDTLLR